MIINITSDTGFIGFGLFGFHWANQDPELDLPAYTCLGASTWSLEFGDIDNGNGIFFTRYKDGEIVSTKTLLRLSV